MKKELLLTAVLLLCAATAQSAERTEDEMKEAAMQVLNSGAAGTRRRAPQTAELQELMVLPMLRIYGYKDGGFAVVSADDRYEAVVGYSDTQFTDAMPCGFKWWLEATNATMESGTVSTSVAARPKSRSRAASKNITPMMTTEWGQNRPYNLYCKTTLKGTEHQFVTGCVATAMAQVMRYHQFPVRGKGNHSYKINYTNWGVATFSADFSQSVYKWEEMLDSYGASYTIYGLTDSHSDAVALLMRDCGIAVDMTYNGKSSGASHSMIPAALQQYFSYDSKTQLYNRGEYSDSEWMDLIYNELVNKHPIIYSGRNSTALNSLGHAFVIHGMDENGKVYVNWGWTGSYDGYYNIDNLRPDGNGYNYYQQMVVAVPGVKVYDVYIRAIGRGFLTCNEDTVTENIQRYEVEEGNELIITTNPDKGYCVGSLMVNGKDVTDQLSDGKYHVSNISSNQVITVSFEKNKNKLNISSAGSGCVKYNELELRNGESKIKIDDSTTITLTVHPDKYYRLTEILVNGQNAIAKMEGNALQFRVTEDTEVSAKFDIVIGEFTDDELDFIIQNEQELTYTGKPQKLSWRNMLEYSGLEVTSDVLTQYVDAGTYNEEITMTLKYGKDIRKIIVPCNYTIKPAKLTAEVNDAERLYGDENPQFTLTLKGLVNDDKQDDVLTSTGKFTTDATKMSPVGVYNVKCSDVKAKNYTIETQDGKLTVMPAKVFAYVNNAMRTYGADNPQFTARYVGFRNGETDAVLINKGKFFTKATKKSDVGEYEISMTDAQAKNYTFEYEPGTLTVTKAKLTATADNAQRLYYEENPEFTVSYEGFVNGDTEAVLTNKGTLTTTATKLSNVGTYTITLKDVEAKNYDVTCRNGVLTVTKGKLTASVENATKTYGDELPEFKIVLSGAPEGVDVSTLDVGGTVITSATKRSDVGDYKLTLTGVWSQQYDIETVDGTLTITPAQVIVRVDNATRPYGEKNPQFSGRYVGWRNGDTDAVLTNKGTFTTTATKNSDVGEYEITATGAQAKNYTFTYEPGVLTIEQAEQQVVWEQSFEDIEQFAQMELTAKATSGLPVSYQLALGGDVCSVVKIGNATFLDCFGAGNVTLAAWQEGNKNYYPTLRTYKQVNVISGIGEIGQGSYKLSSRQGVLLISGLQAGDTVSIHDMAGRQVYSGQDDCIRLARGSYVVRIGRWQQKVLVK